jgi:lauroyl/myristoyl acyltransferase
VPEPTSPRPSFARRHLAEIFAASRVLLWACGKAPRPAGHALAAAASRGLRRITQRRVRENVAKAFPSWTEPQREALFVAHQRYMVRLRLEAARVLEGREGEIERVTTLRGEEHVRRALAMGRGALVVGAHEGTWWHAPAMLAARGLGVKSVFNSFPLRTIEDYLVDRAGRRGIGLSVIGRDATDSLRTASRENAVFYASFDVAVRPESAARFPLAGALLPVERGPAIMARRLRMPVLWVSCEHVADGSLVTIGEPLDPTTLDADALCARWTSELERTLRERPEQWWGWGFTELDAGS